MRDSTPVVYAHVVARLPRLLRHRVRDLVAHNPKGMRHTCFGLHKVGSCELRLLDGLVVQQTPAGQGSVSCWNFFQLQMLPKILRGKVSRHLAATGVRSKSLKLALANPV
jgi:hypothetical protein